MIEKNLQKLFFYILWNIKMGKNKKCWIDDTNALFIDYTIIPHTEMTLASRINCITRLICFIAIMVIY
jgi:hypothetical protein